MRIIFLCSELFLTHGGIQRFNRILLRALAEVGQENRHSVQVFSLNDFEVSDRFAGERCLQLSGFGKNKKKFATQAMKAMRDADLVIYGHVNLLPLGWGDRLLRSIGSSAVIVHGDEAWRPLPWWQRWVASRMKGIISVSSFTAQEFCRLNKLDFSRVSWLPNIIDPDWTEWLNPISRKDQPSLVPTMISVARLDACYRMRYKGIDTVIEAMPSLVSEFPGLRYIVVGEGPDRPRLENLADSLNLGNHVKFTGTVNEPELKEIYRQASVFVLPSGGEGFGIVYLEAMAYGLPVIAARAGGAPEVVLDGQTGLLVPYGDPEVASMAIRQILSDPALARRLGEAGRRRVKEKFTFPRFKERVVQILEKL